MTQNRTISDKEHYHELTAKQKAVIDQIAAEPDAIQQEIADRASEELAKDDSNDVDSVNRSYVSVVTNKYPHIIEQQKQQYDNARGTGGEERAEGNPLQNMDEQLGGDTQGVSTFAERNVTSTQGDNERDDESDRRAVVEQADTGIPVELTPEEAMEVVTSGCSTSLQKRLAKVMVESKVKSSA